MPGLHAVVGHPRHAPRTQESPSSDATHDTEYLNGDVQVSLSTVDESATNQPARTADGATLVWIWGTVFGFDDGDGYARRSQVAPDRSDSAYVGYLYDRFGLAFLEGLNGEFVGCIYDRSDETLFLFTDRLGTRPIYYGATATDALVCSTHLRSIAGHREIDPSFEVAYLYEYFALRRAFGTKTPLAGIESVPPATVMSVDVTTGAYEFEAYWSPTYRPIERPYPQFVTEFVSRFRRVIDDRVRPGETYGVLLSGGADSRLILAALAECDVSIVAFHVNDHENREARVARRVARTAGVEFRFLERDTEYVERVLHREPRVSEYVSWFNQAHFSGFADEIREEVDVVLAGEFAAETVGVFQDFPNHRVDAGFVPQRIPLRKPIATVDDYVDHVTDETPAYLEVPPTVSEVVRSNIRETGGSIEHHGVPYDSLRDMLVFAELYPATNDADYLNYRSLVERHEHWTPFFDRRIVEFTGSYPLRYRLRRNIVHDAIHAIDPELAAIPNANTGIDMTHSFAVDFAASQVQRFKQKCVPQRWARPWYTDHSWPDHGELIRRTSFIEAAIDANRETIERLPFLNYDRVIETLEAHRSGEDRRSELYTLVTVLESPITADIVSEGDD